MEHTKGEWKFNNNGTITFGNEGFNKDANLWDFQYNNEKEFIANGKLIAAAPDLLEALIHLTSNVGLLRKVSESKGTLLEKSFNNAIKAIEKATHKEN